MASAFQRTAFQINAFQTGLRTSSLAILQLPVDCVLAGDQEEHETPVRSLRIGPPALRHAFNEK